MTKSYRKAQNCGPVPYPDQGGRYLRDCSTIVTGDEWEPLVALGFVEHVQDLAPVQAPVAAAPVANVVTMEVTIPAPVVKVASVVTHGGAPVLTMSVTDMAQAAADEAPQEDPGTVMESAMAVAKGRKPKASKAPEGQ